MKNTTRVTHKHEAGVITEIDWTCPECDGDNYDELGPGENLPIQSQCVDCNAEVEVKE